MTSLQPEEPRFRVEKPWTLAILVMCSGIITIFGIAAIVITVYHWIWR